MELRQNDQRFFGGLVLISILTIGLSACTKKQESGSVRISLPQMSASSKLSSGVTAQAVSAMADSGNSWNASLNPSAITDVNCYAVFIGGADLNANYCNVGATSATATTIRFGPSAGFVPAGGEIAFEEVPTGSRVIYVAGLKAQTTAACTSFKNQEPDSTNLSEPFLIASQAVTIASGTNNINVKAALDTTKKILDCKIGGAKNNGGDSAPKFGDGRDGGMLATASSTANPLSAGSATLNSYVTRTGLMTLSNSKIFAASRRMTGIATSGDSAGRLLTVDSSFVSSEFEPGDEIAWYVAGGRSSLGAPDDSLNGACGGGFYLGRYGTARVASVPASNQLLLDRKISSDAYPVRIANLSASASSSDHCAIVITRVSSFDNITLSSGQSITLQAQTFSYSGASGGFLMVRADTIAVGASSTLSILGSGTGYAGGASGGSRYQGDGLNGAGTTTASANYNAGAPGTTSSLGGSGGGNGGSGAIGSGTPTATESGGTAIAHCSGTTGAAVGGICLPLVHYKAYMGGGGGAAGSSAVGGYGGGVVIVHAKTISGAGTIVISANGANGNTGSAGSGGGAGGSIGFFNQTTTGTTLTIQANGGAGGTGTFSGGGGGGGVISLIRCLANFSASLTLESSPGSGGTGAAAGPQIVDNTSACSF